MDMKLKTLQEHMDEQRKQPKLWVLELPCGAPGCNAVLRIQQGEPAAPALTGDWSVNEHGTVCCPEHKNTTWN